MGEFDCPACGWGIGQGHAPDCTGRTRRVDLGLALVLFLFATVLAAAVGAAAVALAAGAASVAVLIAYQPARGQVRRSQLPLAPAPRARTRPT
jgi:hypothetical protein